MVSAAVSRLVACGLLQPGQGMNDVVVASLTLNEKLLRVTNLFKMLMAVVGRNEVTGEVEALMLGVEIVHRCFEKEQQEEKICMKVDLKEKIVLLFYLLDALTNLFSFFLLLLSSFFFFLLQKKYRTVMETRKQNRRSSNGVGGNDEDDNENVRNVTLYRAGSVASLSHTLHILKHELLQ